MILLIQPRGGTIEKAGNRLPLGLLYLATYLKKNCIAASILDMRMVKLQERELRNKLKNVEYVGITCFVGPMIVNSVKIARMVKKIKPDVIVIFGGVHPGLLPEQVLKIPEIDIVVRGEGEEPLKNILMGNNLKNIKGISFRDSTGGIIHNSNQDVLPVGNISIPDYSFVDMDKYSATTYDNERSMSILSSKGCTHRCAFCHHSKNSSWRPFPVELVIKNVEILIKKYQIKTLYFEDDNVAANPDRFFYLLNKLKSYKINLAFQGIRIDTLYNFSEKKFQQMQDYGVRSLDIGVETTSDRLLELINKKLKSEMIVSVAKRLQKYNFNVKFNFIAGIPGQTREEKLIDLKIIKELAEHHKNSFVLYNVYTPFPETELYESALRFGFKPPKDFLGWKVFIGTKWMKRHSWMRRDEQRELEALRFLFIFGNTNILSKVNKKIIRYLIKAYYPIAKYRIRKGYYSFFVEKKLAELFKINI